MKYLKIWENWNYEYPKEQIQEWLGYDLRVLNYSINDDGLVDIDESVDFSKTLRRSDNKTRLPLSALKKLMRQSDEPLYDRLVVLLAKTGKLPFHFGHVTGDFNISMMSLTELEGTPKKVDGTFNCANNKLTSLKDGPIEIRDDFNCSKNFLHNLEFAPQVGRNFSCANNRLTSLYGAPKLINGTFDCASNPKLSTLEFCPEVIVGDFYFDPQKLKTLNFFPKRIAGKSSGEWLMQFISSLPGSGDDRPPVASSEISDDLLGNIFGTKRSADNLKKLLYTLPEHALTANVLNQIRQKYPNQYTKIKSRKSKENQWGTDLQADAGEYGL